MAHDKALLTRYISTFANQLGVYVTNFNYEHHHELVRENCDRYVSRDFIQNVMNSIGYDQKNKGTLDRAYDPEDDAAQAPHSDDEDEDAPTSHTANFKRNNYYAKAHGVVALRTHGNDMEVVGYLLWGDFQGSAYGNSNLSDEDANEPQVMEGKAALEENTMIDLHVLCAQPGGVGRLLLAKFLRQTLNQKGKTHIFVNLATKANHVNPAMQALITEFGFLSANVRTKNDTKWKSTMCQMRPFIRENNYSHWEAAMMLDLEMNPTRGFACSRSANIQRIGYDSYGRKNLPLNDPRCVVHTGWRSGAVMVNDRIRVSRNRKIYG